MSFTNNSMAERIWEITRKFNTAILNEVTNGTMNMADVKIQRDALIRAQTDTQFLHECTCIADTFIYGASITSINSNTTIANAENSNV